MTNKSKFSIVVIAVAVVTATIFAVSCKKENSTETPLTHVTVQFGWIPDGHHAGF